MSFSTAFRRGVLALPRTNLRTANLAFSARRFTTDAKVTGVVKWFSDDKGYGFITRDGTQTDVFVHHTGIAGEGFKSLEQESRVEFEVFQGTKGDQARDVRALS